MEKLGYQVRRFDLPEWNFENVADRRRLWKLYVEEAPDVVWVAPPCTLWTPLQTWNKDLDALEVLWTWRRFDYKSHLSMAHRLYRGQLKRRKVGVVEHPWTSSTWRTPAFKNLGGHTVDLDQCAFGSVLPGDDGLPTPIKKRTCLKVTVEDIVRDLSRKRPADHPHQHVVGNLPGGGSRAKAAGAYQPEFCHALAEALDRAHLGHHGTSCETNDVVDAALLKYDNGDDTAEEIARLALSNEDYSYETLEKVANAIDGQAQREGRHKKDGQLEENEFIFIGGRPPWGISQEAVCGPPTTTTMTRMPLARMPFDRRIELGERTTGITSTQRRSSMSSTRDSRIALKNGLGQGDYTTTPRFPPELWLPAHPEEWQD